MQENRAMREKMVDFTPYQTENQDLLDFATYKIDDQMILVGGPIPVDEAVVVDVDIDLLTSSDPQTTSLQT